jgi:Arc/MetJ-type ribon-helix-helix transcriptional regulator
MTYRHTASYAENMTQIAVKLPDGLVKALDALVEAGRFESRSHAVRYGVEHLVRSDERRRIDEAFRSGFAEHPETPAELEDARRLAIDSIEDEPWEKWW